MVHLLKKSLEFGWINIYVWSNFMLHVSSEAAHRIRRHAHELMNVLCETIMAAYLCH